MNDKISRREFLQISTLAATGALAACVPKNPFSEREQGRGTELEQTPLAKKATELTAKSNAIAALVERDYGVTPKYKAEVGKIPAYEFAASALNPGSRYASIAHIEGFHNAIIGRNRPEHIELEDRRFLSSPDLSMEEIKPRTQFVSQTLSVILKEHPQRIAVVDMESGEQECEVREGRISWGFRRPDNALTPDSYRALIHESIHGAMPAFQAIVIDGNVVGLSGISLVEELEHYIEWADVVTNNWDYFKQRFLDKEDDQILGHLQYYGGAYVPGAIGEFAAMLCTEDLLTSGENLEYQISQMPQDVSRQLLVTLKYVVHGPEEFGRDISLAEVADINHDLATLYSNHMDSVGYWIDDPWNFQPL